jgi:hypothetical protein
MWYSSKKRSHQRWTRGFERMRQKHVSTTANGLSGREKAPVEALRRWMRSNLEFVATKKGMLKALALAASSSSELSAYSFDRGSDAPGRE